MVKSTDRPAMTIAVDLVRKATKQKHSKFLFYISKPVSNSAWAFTGVFAHMQ